ncbi:RidA family protein, partial [Streptomyces sp. NPDC059278]
MDEKITRINPEQLHQTPGYHHVTVVEAGRTAHLAGQCPLDGNGALVGADSFETQVDQVV